MAELIFIRHSAMVENLGQISYTELGVDTLLFYLNSRYTFMQNV